MRQFIARLLNMVPREDYESLQREHAALRESLVSLNGELSRASQEVGAERENVKELQKMLIASSREQPAMQPVKVSAERWSSLRSRMEADDRRRAESEQSGVH